MLLLLYLAIIIDLSLGEPPVFIHPVVWTGKISGKLIRPYKGKLYGMIMWIISVIPVLILLLLPLEIPWFIVKIIVLSVFLKTTFSIKMLYNLVKKSIPVTQESRKYTQQLVRRNVYELDEPHVISAAIESLFESLVDGIISPLFWFLILGYPGAILQRLSNTMDSMVGYKTPELINEGWFSAKVDTILNYIPARLTAAFMYLAGYIMGLKAERFSEIIKNSGIESTNARYPIGAASSVLKVKLEKLGYYSVGYWKLPTEKDLTKALKLFKLTLFLFLLVLSVIYYYLYGVSFLSYPYGLIELIYSKFMGD